ncbi:hypothetical protein [Hyphomicrobium sp. DMF-1]|jgi:hypothetical protein|uniref:hypothetical protein n=1 Tax=Hyphomicrobium sp. DMF-1 TaxID=3019544 RepID=UPI0022EBC604|nr:hypothetical protein [Hyphomicrobium sp. DMF-1]WBT36621.1 hypothetical protein PE058_13255 [Hyphomicrobium sp. DMF-1]
MSFTKNAAVAALVVASALTSTMTAANAHGKKHWGFHHHHRYYGGPVIVIGTPDYGCRHWLKRYHATGKKFFLKKYYACKY